MYAIAYMVESNESEYGFVANRNGKPAWFDYVEEANDLLDEMRADYPDTIYWVVSLDHLSAEIRENRWS